MYEDSITLVSTTVGETGKICLHQGSTPIPLLFIIIMDDITEDIEEETPWVMLMTLPCQEKAVTK